MKIIFEIIDRYVKKNQIYICPSSVIHSFGHVIFSFRRKEELNRRQTAERRRAEAEKKERTRLLRRTSPIWSQLAVANDSNSYQERKRAKILAERERQMMYNAAMNDMLSRVWQQPPLFARKST